MKNRDAIWDQLSVQFWSGERLQKYIFGHFRTKKNKREKKYNLSKKNSRLLRIYLLDNVVIDWPLTNRATGADCIQHIESKLQFDESRYFGLKYLPKSSKSNPGRSPPSPRWVNLNKPLKAQLSNLTDDLTVYLRIMFYVANISVFTSDMTRYHYYLQIRNDVIGQVVNFFL